MSDSHCPFCAPAAERIVRAFDAVLVLRDGFPISPGHTLIVPRRHVASFFALEAGLPPAIPITPLTPASVLISLR